MQNLHSFLLILLTFSFCMVIFSSNPVHSVLFLILSFCISSIILLLFKIDFLGILFVIIYVGAIAVLFLFVVMMLNVKVFAIYPFYLRFLPLLLLLTFFNSIFLIDLLNEGYILPVEYQNVENVDSFNNIDLFGQIFFGYFITIFLLSGFILLVAMLGSIILTLTLKSKRTSELSSRQLSRVGSIESFN